MQQNIYQVAGLIFILYISITGGHAAAADREFRESRKCSTWFSYFEKKYNLPPYLLHSISLHETAKKHSRHNIPVVWPWSVMNNKEGKGHYFKTPEEAIRYVRLEFIKGNNNLDVGCMQINLKHHPEAFSSLRQAFFPRNNIAYGAYFLNQNIQKLGSIEMAIGRYHSATAHLAEQYRKRVSKISLAMNEYNDNLKRIVLDLKYAKSANSYETLYAQAIFDGRRWEEN